MYEKHFGFSIKPFQTVPNPEIFYLSPKHENALTYLEYGIMERAGFVLLTGEVGSGKTTLIRYLLNKIESDIETAVIFNTNISADQLIEMIINEFDIGPCQRGKAQALDILFKYLIEMFSRNRRVLIIIDEAQNLDMEALEEVRMLSNLQSDDQVLLQIMLVGQPELNHKLMSPELSQLNQRITVAYHIPALSWEETQEYIAFRLEKAGGKRGLFTPDAVELIFEASGGIPRNINIICDTALVYGYSDELTQIDVKVVEQVMEDREGMRLPPRAETSPKSLEGRPDNGDLLHRLKSLEEGLSRLQVQMDARLEHIEKSAGGYRDEMVARFRDMYAMEKEKNDELMAGFAKLKGTYLDLSDRLEHMEAQPSEDAGSDYEVHRGEPRNSSLTEEFIAKRESLKREVDDAIRELMQHTGDGKADTAGTRPGRKKGLMGWLKS